MKKFLSILGAAALAFTMVGERADAFNSSVGSFSLTGDLFPEGDLPAIDGGAPENLTGDKITFDNFFMTKGSYNDVDNFVKPGDPGSPIEGSWHTADLADSYARSYQYAEQFKADFFSPTAGNGGDPALNQLIADADNPAEDPSLPLFFAFAYDIDGAPQTVFSWGVLVQTLNGITDVTLAAARLNEDSDTVNVPSTSTNEVAGAHLYYATLFEPDNFPDPVPEIDGPVLVQVGFALMGLYVLMLGRRRREDEGDLI